MPALLFPDSIEQEADDPCWPGSGVSIARLNISPAEAIDHDYRVDLALGDRRRFSSRDRAVAGSVRFVVAA